MPMQPPIAPTPKYMKDGVDSPARRTMENVSKRTAERNCNFLFVLLNTNLF